MKYYIHETRDADDKPESVGLTAANGQGEFDPQVPPPEGGRYVVLHAFEVDIEDYPAKVIRPYYEKPSSVKASAYFNEYMGYDQYEPFCIGMPEIACMMAEQEAREGRDMCKEKGLSGEGIK